MRDSASEGVKFALFIFAPLLIVGAGLILLTASMLNGISQSVDNQEHLRAWQAAQSAFKAEQARLGSVLTDNAHWGEAVLNSYAPINEEWVKSMWGTSSSDVNYDTAILVQPDGKVLAAFRKGEKADLTIADYVGSERFTKLVADLPKDKGEFEAIPSIVVTTDGPMVMAAGPIVPAGEEGVVVPASRANLLILGQHITSNKLAYMGNQYIVDRLAFTSLGDATQGDGVISDRWNEPVLRVVWQDRHPGDAASREHKLGAMALLAGLLMLVVPITVLHYRAMAQLARNRQEAHHSARHDGLTGLANRTFLIEELKCRLAGAQSASTALVYIDLDGFKSVNDAYGHEIGDTLLRMIAAGLRELAGRHAIMRLGGDEFAVLVTGQNYQAAAERLAQSIVEFVREPLDVRGRSAVIGASVGLARAEPNIEPVELLRRADIAMYDAKESGRGNWQWFNDKLDEKLNDGLRIAVELRDILSKDLLEIAYQPIVDASTRNITGVEALARWPQSSKRRLTPTEFIPVAEEHGLISALGQQVMRKACRDFTRWTDIRLAVNVSAIQLNDKAFLESLLAVTQEVNFNPERLEVEFTESVLIRNSQRAKAVIAELHQHRIKVSLDDFGTGYASVGYLRSFDFDRIKLDRSLSQSILNDDSAQKVVQGTVLIARALSAEIIAEGIESEEEAQIMRLSGCHELQGYFLGRPQSLAQIQHQLGAAGETLPVPQSQAG